MRHCKKLVSNRYSTLRENFLIFSPFHLHYVLCVCLQKMKVFLGKTDMRMDTTCSLPHHASRTNVTECTAGKAYTCKNITRISNCTKEGNSLRIVDILFLDESHHQITQKRKKEKANFRSLPPTSQELGKSCLFRVSVQWIV